MLYEGKMVRPERFELPTFWFVARFGQITQKRSLRITAFHTKDKLGTADTA